MSNPQVMESEHPSLTKYYKVSEYERSTDIARPQSADLNAFPVCSTNGPKSKKSKKRAIKMEVAFRQLRGGHIGLSFSHWSNVGRVETALPRTP